MPSLPPRKIRRELRNGLPIPGEEKITQDRRRPQAGTPIQCAGDRQQTDHSATDQTVSSWLRGSRGVKVGQTAPG